MYSNELPTNFGILDLLGGVALGKYYEGVLPDGFNYRFEARGTRTALDIFSGENGGYVFGIRPQDQGGMLLVIPDEVGVYYDREGRLGWAGLYVNTAAYQAQRQGIISLPEAVMTNVRNQLVNGIVWIVTMDFTNAEPIVFFNQQQREPTAPYKLEFDRGWRYPIPGVDWGVGVVQSGDLLGFEIAGSDGLGQKFWFNRSLDQGTLPRHGGVAGLEVEKLRSVFFPGYPLAMAEAGGKGK